MNTIFCLHLYGNTVPSEPLAHEGHAGKTMRVTGESGISPHIVG